MRLISALIPLDLPRPPRFRSPDSPTSNLRASLTPHYDTASTRPKPGLALAGVDIIATALPTGSHTLSGSRPSLQIHPQVFLWDDGRVAIATLLSHILPVYCISQPLLSVSI